MYAHFRHGFLLVVEDRGGGLTSLGRRTTCPHETSQPGSGVTKESAYVGVSECILSVVRCQATLASLVSPKDLSGHPLGPKAQGCEIAANLSGQVLLYVHFVLSETKRPRYAFGRDSDSEEEDRETAAEKRLRLASEYLAKLETAGGFRVDG